MRVCNTAFVVCYAGLIAPAGFVCEALVYACVLVGMRVFLFVRELGWDGMSEIQGVMGVLGSSSM
jgi:hypothetical protein